MQAIGEAVGFVEQSGASAQALFQTRFVLEEMGTNILKYGYRDSLTHQVHFEVDVEAGSICFKLMDDGHEFDPTTAPPPDTTQPLEERPLGGLGLALVRKLVRRLEYQRHAGRNIVTVVIDRRA